MILIDARVERAADRLADPPSDRVADWRIDGPRPAAHSVARKSNIVLNMTEILMNFVSMPLVVWQQTANQLGPVSVPVLLHFAYEDRVSFDAHVFRRPK